MVWCEMVQTQLRYLNGSPDLAVVPDLASSFVFAVSIWSINGLSCTVYLSSVNNLVNIVVNYWFTYLVVSYDFVMYEVANST